MMSYIVPCKACELIVLASLCRRAKTIRIRLRVDAYFFEHGEKNPDTRGKGVRSDVCDELYRSYSRYPPSLPADQVLPKKPPV